MQFYVEDQRAFLKSRRANSGFALDRQVLATGQAVVSLKTVRLLFSSLLNTVTGSQFHKLLKNMNARSLLLYRPDGSTVVFEIAKPIFKIGRSSENDVVLEDTGRRISREQAQLVCDGDAPPLLSDLKSANGTLLNDKLVTEPSPLRPYDVIRIGQYRIVYRDASARADSAEPEPESAFRIEAASVELNEIQQRQGLLALADSRALDASSMQMRTLDLLHEVGVRLARTFSPADVIETSVDLAFKIEGAQRAGLSLWDEELQAFIDSALYTRGGDKLKLSETMASQDPRNLVLSRAILRKVREENRPLHIRDTRAEGLRESMSIMLSGIQAAFCSPLTFQGRLLGILYADNLESVDAFSQDDFRTFTTIAAQAGLALSSALTRGELLKREVQHAAMRLYLPPQVADMITTTDGLIELGGVLQPVTVLFADIRGFTSLSEGLDAPEVVSMLNEFFTIMTKVIFEAGGTLDKYIGDCVMALFGAPVPAEDDLDRGLRTAINMQREVACLNESRRRRGLHEIQIGVGLHTGPAVVGNIGSEQRMQYTAIGDTVNIAARLVGKAAPGQVLVSEHVRNTIRGNGELQHLGEVELKGRKAKVTVYSVPWEASEQPDQSAPA